MKYQLTNETKTFHAKKLYRIKALIDFNDVKAGDLGGWVASKDNLSQEGDCWVYDNSKVFDKALVYGNAKVFGNAEVSEDAQVFGNAEVFDGAEVYGEARVFDSVQVFGRAKVYGDARVFDNVKVFGRAKVYDNTKVYGDARVFGLAQVYGNAKVFDIAFVSGNSEVYEDAQVFGNTMVFGLAKVYGSDIVSGSARVYKMSPKKEKEDTPMTTPLTGGPAKYYDLPFRSWETTNDMGEHLAKERWGAYSLHFKDLLKALVRFGAKDGTTMQYDVEKMIYSGCRVMVMLLGKKALRDYLQRLLDEPQFKE